MIVDFESVIAEEEETVDVVRKEMQIMADRTQRETNVTCACDCQDDSVFNILL